MKYRVHANDKLSLEAFERLSSNPSIEASMEHLEPEVLKEKVEEFDVLIVRSATKVTREIIERGKKLRIIARAGVGLDNIDLEAAKERNIKVLNTPGASAPSVAELTIGLMLAVSRHIPRGTMGLKEGKWEKKQLQGHELLGKTLGIIGFGNIGYEVAKRAKAFGMEIIAYDVVQNPRDLDVTFVDLDELFKRSDYITLHVPLNPQTKHLINEESIKKMKDGVFIINAARGGVVDEKALYEALVSGKVKGAALDVFEVEPPNDDLRMKLLALDNVVATPHIGASTVEGQKRVGMEIVEKVIEELGV